MGGCELLSKVTKPPVLAPLALPEPSDTVPPFQVPWPVGARSNMIAKNTLNVLEEPQNPPPVVLPVTVEPLMEMVPLRSPVAIRLVLMSSRAPVAPGCVLPPAPPPTGLGALLSAVPMKGLTNGVRFSVAACAAGAAIAAAPADASRPAAKIVLQRCGCADLMAVSGGG